MSGFFGCVSKDDCVYDVFYGTDYHSHLGTKRAGMVFYSSTMGFQRSIHNIENNYFRNKFESNVARFQGNIGMGVISDYEPQPILLTSHLGRYAVATVARIVNLEEIQNRLLKKGYTYSETMQRAINPTELVALLIAEGDSFVSGIENVFKNIKGTCSILLLTEKNIIAARDKLGRTPIVISKKKGCYSASFESSAFTNLGFEIVKYLGAGEIVSISADGYELLRSPNENMQICSFLWIYYGYPPSNYEGINVDECRYRCGEKIAENDYVNADFASEIPDSGCGHVIGYCNARKIPLKRAFIKYTPTWSRSFMSQNQEDRKTVAKMKLIANEYIVRGNVGVFFDDSIVRGTQLTDNVKKLRNAKIKEFHMRIACPPLTHQCEFLNFSRSRSNFDLITHRTARIIEGNDYFDMKKYSDNKSEEHKEMVEIIRKTLNLDTLIFQKIEDLPLIIGLPKEKICTHCFDGSSYF